MVDDDGVIIGDRFPAELHHKVEEWPFGDWPEQEPPYRIYKDLVQSPPISMVVNLLAFSDSFGIDNGEFSQLFEKFASLLAPLHEVFALDVRVKVRHRTGLEDLYKKCAVRE